MKDRAKGTMPRSRKGKVAPPPSLSGNMAIVADAVSGWPGVIATCHWSLTVPDRVDGIDFYVGDDELGHIHLNGNIHLATSPRLGTELIEKALARPFPYIAGWVHNYIDTIGSVSAIHLFRRNYDRLVDNA